MAVRYPGQSIVFGPNRLTANELNRTGEAVERAERSRLGYRNRDSASEHLTWWVWVRNDTGADRHRFETVSLGQPIMDLELDGSVDPILSAIALDTTKAPAILIDEIASGEFGRACGYGCALALVEAGSSSYGTPNASYTLDPAGSGPFRLLAPPSETEQTLVPVLWAGGTRRDIEFTIDTVETRSGGDFDGLRVATVTVYLSSDQGLVGETEVEVVDHSGCLLDESDEALEGRWGWASERYGPGAITLHFSIDGLCCPP